MPALEVRELTVGARGRRILERVSFRVERGSVLLVTGPSGAGKTTLLRVLAGVARGVYGLHVEGRASLGGLDLLAATPRERARAVAYIPQEPWYSIVTPYVALEFSAMLGFNLDEAGSVLSRFGLEGRLLASTIHLSAGEAQRLAVAEAVTRGAQLILMDEVTSYLDEASRKSVVEAVVEAKEGGAIVLVVDHDPALWRGVADEVLYLEEGRSSLLEDPAEAPNYEALLELRGARRSAAAPKGGVVAFVNDLWFKYPDDEDFLLRGVSFECQEGEIVWVRGGSGRGKSTLLKLLAGVFKPSKGMVRTLARPQFIPENPLLYLSEPTPLEEVGGNIEALRLAGLEKAARTPITALSSGERRRLALVSAYLKSPKLLLVDEPTVGLDPWNAVRVLNLMARLAARGTAVIVASHGEELGLVASKVVAL